MKLLLSIFLPLFFVSPLAAAPPQDIFNRMMGGDQTAAYEYHLSTGADFNAISRKCFGAENLSPSVRRQCVVECEERDVVGEYADLILDSFGRQSSETKADYLSAVPYLRGDVRAWSIVKAGIIDKDANIRIASLRLFKVSQSSVAIEQVKNHLSDADPLVAATARLVLSEGGDLGQCAQVRKDLTSKSAAVREIAIETMGFCGGKADLKSLERIKTDSTETIYVRRNALTASRWIGLRSEPTPQGRASFLKAVMNDAKAKMSHIWALQRLKDLAMAGETESLGVLKAIAADESSPNRADALLILNRMK